MDPGAKAALARQQQRPVPAREGDQRAEQREREDCEQNGCEEVPGHRPQDGSGGRLLP